MKPTKFVYTELHTDDAPKARAFYADLLGWEYQDVPRAPTDYALIRSGGEVFGGIAGRSSTPPLWLPYIGVADVKAMTTKAKVLGAKIEVECREFGGFGTLTVLADPTGARVGLWQEARK